MKYQKFFYFLQNVGKDPSALIFEDELTGLYNRRYILDSFRNRVNWEALESSPLCLMMIDVDYLKHINDQYGHNVGDQALIHIAEIIKSAAPKNTVAVRYAGDNFLLLLSGRQKADSRALAEKLLFLTRKNKFSSPETGTEIPLTLSIGIASAPGDASDEKNLIQMADAARYHAKRSGRDRYADAEELEDTELFPKTALRYLGSAAIAGRKEQLARVGSSLKKAARGSSQFIIVEGAAGMGKTSFLSTIQENLEKTRLRPIRVNGSVQEAFRPYYLVSYIAMALMNRLEDKGMGILESMQDSEIYRLSHIIPQLRSGALPFPENDSGEREEIFNSFARLLTRLAEGRPLVLLIDDFHYCDPASLYLIRALMKKGDPVIFICAAAAREEQTFGESVALDLFRNAHSEELGIRTIPLTPLTETNIAKQLNMIFEGIYLPEGLCREIARVTQGNPLFMVEIIRKMISDGKIFMQQKKWTVSEIEKDYFPRSLEEIIQAKMENLDEESKKFLDRASAFGESTFLSMLAGITRDDSARIYDIINNAEEQGIVRTEFEENDENIRFSSKKVRDIIYDGISPEEKKMLHRQIGAYQEKLFEQDLLPSRSFLAHHFGRSTDPEKARTYADFQQQHNRRVFDPEETGLYTKESHGSGETAGQPDTGLGDAPLSRQSMELVPYMLRALLVAVRNTRLYPAGSKSVTSAARDLLKLLERIFQTNAQISVTSEQKKLWINGEDLPESTPSAIAEKILELWDRLEIKSLIFRQGLTENELQTMLDELAGGERKTIPPDFWDSFTQNRGLSNIIPRQVTYKEIQPRETEEEEFLTSGKEETKIYDEISQLELEQEDWQHLPESQLQQVKKVISALLGAYSQLKLYPADGPVAKKAVRKLFSQLQAYLTEYRILTVVRVDEAILVNGVKVDTTGFEALFGGMVKLLSEAGLSSLTFSEEISENELEEFFRALFRATGQEKSPDFWRQFSRRHNPAGLFFNQRLYDIQQVHSRAEAEDTDSGDSEESRQSQKTQEAQKESPPEPEEKSLAERLQDLYLKGETEHISAILGETAQKYTESDSKSKADILNNFSTVLNPPHWQPEAGYLKLVTGPLIGLFDKETREEAVEQASEILHKTCAKLVLLGEYREAARIFTRLQQHPQLNGTSALETWDMPHVFGKSLDSRIADTLSSDLKSEDKKRRQEACQLISTMGQGIVPMLIDIIKQKEDLRTRHLAAELLGRTGQPGIEQLKQALISESQTEEKSRILEIIDSVTTELTTELRYTLMDPQDTVRRQAFRLAQRIDKPEVNTLLAELAHSSDSELAISAINTLGRRKAAQASKTLIEITAKTRDPEILIAACRAMGRIGSRDFIEPLAKILIPGRRWLKSRKYPSRVRIAAAYAAYQIQGKEVQTMMEALRRDPDPKVREAVSMLR
ncbi:MAG: diguanylate cyclase [Desulfobacterales bacterium]|nr:diguanylate cyclase [Desulfobacterales bacterium]